MISTFRLLLITLSSAVVALSAQATTSAFSDATLNTNAIEHQLAPQIDDKSVAEASATAVVIEKGPIDSREYHYFTLANQLRVLLISDPHTDKAAASLDVHVGSSDDPHDREGLAHFLEHMLFLGTAKYPDAAEYQAFISANGGSHNAYTSPEHTNYFFDVDANQLEPALDRFSQFFIAPLFDEVYVDRERNAVHSEYQAKIRDDSRRGYDVYRNLLNPQHPYAKFSVGSLTTLADRSNDKVRDDLLAFYAQHYASEEMTLVVLGKQSIAQLKLMVEQRFSLIPQKPSVDLATAAETTPSSTSSAQAFIPLFAKDTLPMEVVSQPVKETRQMTMVFPLPSIKPYYAEKPFNFLGHILGHEGKGSLLSVLKAQGWAEGLSAGGNETGAGNSAFNISITLTEEGVRERAKIRALVFHALDVLRKKGVKEWRYAEEQQLAKVAFQFRENARAINTVSALSNNLHDYPAAEVLSADYLYKQFDAKLIKRYLSKMTPDNLYVTTVFPEAKTDQVTHYYQVPYAVERLPKKAVKIPRSLKKQYQLPGKNIFIPENIALFPADKKLAEPLLSSSASQQIWSKQDVSFGVPKASLSIRVKSPAVSQSASNAAMNQLLLAMIRDRLNERSYPAIIAGVNFSFSPNSRGFDIGVQGYHDKIDVLLAMIVAEIEQPVLKQERFNSIKTELLRSLSNSSKQTPFRQLMKQVPVNVFAPYWPDAELVSALGDVSFKQLKGFAQQWRQGATTQALFYGNIDMATTQRWQQAIAVLPQAPHKDKPALAPAQVIKLNPGQAPLQFSLPVDHNDKAVALYVQGVSDSLDDQAKMVLLRQVLESSFYTQLRTEQQLGYIVFLTSMTLKEVPGSLFMVQSPSASVEQVKAAITTFVQQSLASLPDDISVYQQSAATKLLEKPQQLSAQAQRYWQNILRDNTSFNYRQRLVEAINQVSAQQLKDYYQQVLLEQQRLLWFVAAREAEASTQPLFSEDQAKYQYP